MNDNFSKRIPFIFVFLAFFLLLTFVTTSRYIKNADISPEARVANFSKFTLNKTVDYYIDLHSLVQPGVDINAEYIVDFGPSETSTAIFMVFGASGFISDDNKFMYSNVEIVGKKFSFSVSDEWTYLRQDGDMYVYYTILEPGTDFSYHLIKDNTIHVDRTIRRTDTDLLDSCFLSATFYAVQAGYFENIESAYMAAKGSGI